MNYLKKFAVGIAAIIAAANSLGYMPYNPVDLPVLTAEAADIVASGECGAEGDNVKWQLDSEGTLTISGEGEMKRFSYSSPAPWKTESIKKLVVENGVTNIVKEAFADCSSLTSVTISDSVTTIGEAAFKNCSLLTSINIPKNVTIIDNETFKGCSGLASITIPDGVTAIKSLAFGECSNLTSVVIPDSVISIGYSAFYNCDKLTSITIPDSVTAIGGAVFAGTPWLETKKTENPFVIVNNILIDGTACKGDIAIPDNVVCIADYSFQANLELTSATIPDSITNIGNSIFSYCSNLTSVKIPNSITVIPGAMFENCQKLNKITLPESIKTIGTNAFFNCSELNSITIKNSECVIEDSEKTICNTYDISTKETGFTGTIYGYPNSTAQAYAEKYNRKFVALDEKPAAEIVASGECGAEGDNVKWQLDSEGTLTISGEGEMKNYDFEEDAPWYREYYQEGGVTKVIIEDGVTSIGDMAFNECVYLTSITIPDSVTSIGFRAFYWTALDSVTIPDSVTTIGEDAFSGCSKLDTITIPDSVTAIGNNAFEQTPWLEIRIAENPLVTVNNILIDGTACKGDITIPENITHIVTSAFSKSEELTAIYVDENNKNYTSENGVLFNKNKTTLVSYPIGNTAKEYTIPDGVVNIEDEAFFRCENLTSVIIPDGVKNIGNYAFYWCNGLLSVDISDTVESIGEYAFNNCNDLISIKIPDSVTSLGMAAVSSCYGLETAEIGNGVRKIDDYTFSYCKNLTFVTIGNNVEHIGELAFQACQKLESVTIPDSVISIGNSAFKGCSSLSSIEIPANVETIDKYAFESCDGLKSITIYNPDCFIDSDMYDTLYSTAEIATIYGYKGSTAQSYARDNKLDFIDLDEGKPATEIVASGECGEEGYDLTWSLDSKGTLTISGTGEMDSWALNSPWSEHSDKITKVIIENGVTTIGEQAFSGCKKIAEISIPDSVTNIKTGAFFDCTGLTSIKIPESVTETGHSVFYGCVNLKEVTLPNGVGTINTGVFRDCQSLETITFSKNVIKVDFTALCGCSNLKSVIFEHPGCKIADAEHTICNSHDFDTEENVFNGTIYGYENSTAQAYAEKYNRTFVALEGKPAIEIIDSGECGVMEEDGVFWMFDSEGTLTISGAWGSMYFHDDNIPWGKYQKDIVKVVVEKGVTGIEVAAFSYCTNLKSVTISSDVMYIGPYAFSGCTSLESIVIPDGVTDIEYSTFKDCKNLTSITLPESIVEIGHSAFEGCEKLASITLKNPECVIDDVENTIPDTTVIYGCKNSNVQAYAEKYNIKFVALDEKPAADELGDVNSDGKVDSSDASLVLEEYAVIQTGGAGAFTENQKKAADVNKDGKTDSSDASKILEYYAMISTGKEPSWD